MFHHCYLGTVGKHCICLLDVPILNKTSLQNQNAGARGRVKGKLLSQCHHHFVCWGTCGSMKPQFPVSQICFSYRETYSGKANRTTGTKPGYPAAVHTELSLCQHRDCVHKVCTYTLDYIIASHSMMNQWQDGKQWWFISLGTYAWSSKWRFKKYQNVGSITKDGIFQLFNVSLVDIMSVSFQVTKTHNQIYSVDSTGVSRL